MVDADHVTWILASDWSKLETEDECDNSVETWRLEACGLKRLLGLAIIDQSEAIIDQSEDLLGDNWPIREQDDHN